MRDIVGGVLLGTVAVLSAYLTMAVVSWFR